MYYDINKVFCFLFVGFDEYIEYKFFFYILKYIFIGKYYNIFILIFNFILKGENFSINSLLIKFIFLKKFLNIVLCFYSLFVIYLIIWF